MFKSHKYSNFLGVAVQFIAVFTVVFFAYMYLYRGGNYPFLVGEDSFYHVAFAKYMAEHGLIIHQFPYLNFTFLKDNFIDWHFLFHILLLPFVKLFGDLLGAKIFGCLALAGAFGMVYLIFREFKLKFAALYAIALFFLMPAAFYFRLSYTRAPVLSLFLLLMAIYWVIKNRPIALAVTMFFYVWSYYVASYFIFGFILAYLAIQLFRGEKINYQLLIWGTIGFLAGFVLNPYFPANLDYFSTFLRASANDRWYAGSELFPDNTWSWFYGSAMAAILFFGAIIFSTIKNLRQTSIAIALFIFSFFVLVMEWKSKRFAEYWPLLGGVAGFALIAPYLEEIMSTIKKNWKKVESIFVIVIILVFFGEGVFHGIWEYWQLKKMYPSTAIGMENLRDAAQYLEKNSSPKDLVFTRWDVFPELFYYNQKDYYVTGMDPIFLQDYNSDLFDVYIDITMNKGSTLDVKLIKEKFHPQWVLIDQPEDPLKAKLQKEPEIFQQVYENSGYTVYKVL